MNRSLRNTLAWTTMGLTVWGLVLVIPDWFGRPDWGWWLVTAGSVAGLAVSISTFRRRDHDTGVMIGVMGFIGFALLLGGLGIVIAAIVRLNALGDQGALGVGLACLIGGGILGLLLLNATIRLIGQPPGEQPDPPAS